MYIFISPGPIQQVPVSGSAGSGQLHPLRGGQHDRDAADGVWLHPLHVPRHGDPGGTRLAGRGPPGLLSQGGGVGVCGGGGGEGGGEGGLSMFPDMGIQEALSLLAEGLRDCSLKVGV